MTHDDGLMMQHVKFMAVCFGGFQLRPAIAIFGRSIKHSNNLVLTWKQFNKICVLKRLLHFNLNYNRSIAMITKDSSAYF